LPSADLKSVASASASIVALAESCPLLESVHFAYCLHKLITDYVHHFILFLLHIILVWERPPLIVVPTRIRVRLAAKLRRPRIPRHGER